MRISLHGVRLSAARAGLLVAAAWGAFASQEARASNFDIIINELCYHPFSGDDRDEFIELYNRGPSSVDLTGWSFGEGVTYTFPPGVSLAPGEFLVVSPDAQHARARYGISNVVGNYTGRLDNDGETISLLDAAGGIMGRLRYGDGETWPSNPDGLGPTLELMTPHEQNDLPQKWASSLPLEGTPGRRNSRFRGTRLATTLGAQDDLYQTWKGTAEPSSPILRWTERGFEPGAGWQELQGPFGVGNWPFTTELTDMIGSYTTYYLRRVFDLDAASLAELQSGAAGLNLRLSYDDAFVAYLNGVEVGRANVGTPGVPVPRDAQADGRQEGTSTINIDLAGITLASNGNVLAVQGLNGPASIDFFLSVELILSPRAISVQEVSPTVVINEVRPSEGGPNGFLELHNRTAATVELAGHWLVDSLGNAFQIPGGTPIASRTVRAFTEAQLGFSIAISGASYALLRPDGTTWLNGIDPGPGPTGVAGLSFGRFPDGDEDQYLMSGPTQGAPNALTLISTVVINEVLYHPPFVAPSAPCLRQCSDPDQWLELHNRGAGDVNVGGWSLTKAVDFTIPAGTVIPGGGYLVIAADRARFLAAHPAVNPVRVLGGWTKSLARDSDTINLRDFLGNRVDHVKYGDGRPTNDEDPEDGVDDRTILSSDWPHEPDGSQGRTLELIHPSLDNRAGRAWAAGPAGGTPAAANSTLDATPPPVVWDVENEPESPRSDQPVVVSCRVTSLAALQRVEAIWHLDPAGAPATVALRDDGLSGDKAAGDGIFAGTIPAQAANRVVGFQVLARTAAPDSQERIVPPAPAVLPYTGFQGPYFLYRVDDTIPPANDSTTYRIVMTTADLNELEDRDVQSNVLLPCTFIGEGKAHHVVGIRIRGESTRQNPWPRKPWRIDFPPERGFRGLEHVNLVSTNIQNEILAADLFRRAGLPSSQEWTVNLYLQGSLDPLYAFKENMDGEFLDRHFGGSSGGNLYRAIDPLPAGGQPQGDLTYYGEDPDDLLVYQEVYEKRSNEEEADYTDIIALCRAFDPAATPDAIFPEVIDGLIDAEQWARFFAVQSCITNADGGIQTGTGEDYLLYKVPEASPRHDRGKWLLIPWDIDESFRNASEPLFRPNIPGIRRFLTHPVFSPLYYAALADLRAGAFSRFETRQRFYLIDDLYGFSTIDGIDSYITDRIGFYDLSIPAGLSAGMGSAISGGLINDGDLWRYFKGTAEPSGGNRSWTTRGFSDDAPGWLEGPTGIGYGDGDDRTVLDDMEGGYLTAYLRKRFVVPDPAVVTSLDLIVDYDDGFVAYLNGQEVARRNAPGPEGSFVAFDDTASDAREAGNAETIDLDEFRNLLVAGDNVLAIQVLNQSLGSSDLSMIPVLASGAQAVGAGCGTVLYATGSSATLRGRAEPSNTRSVTVGGAPADYQPTPAIWTAAVTLQPGENRIRVEAFDSLGRSLEVMEVVVHRLARPFTPLGGTLGGNTTLTAAESPYLMGSNVVVPQGVRLTIEPGTIVLGQSGASIIVRGELLAVGTRESPILFRAFTCQSRMGGIAFDGTGAGAGAFQHRMQFCEVEFADAPSGFQGTVAPVNSKLLVEDCVFRDLTANAIDATDARLEVRRSLFERISEGVHCTSSVVIVVDSTFSHMIGDNDAIDFDLNGPGGERSRIERCVMEYSSDDGIDLQATTVDIRDNICRFIQDKAMSLEQNGPIGGPTITGNLIHDSGTAIALKSGVVISEGHHNTVVGNQEGVNLFAKNGAPDGGHGVFDSMIIWNNIYDVKLDTRSTVSFTFSDIGNLWPGVGNISADPGFRNFLTKDFSLAAGSPAIGTGKAGTDMGAIPFSGPVTTFVRADADASGAVALNDAVATLDYLFRAAAGPSCLDRLDSNDDGSVDVSDPVFTLFYLFAEGAEPRPPFPAPGVDPTADGLECL